MDDFPLSGATGKLKEQTIKVLKTEFNVNNMGELKWSVEIQKTFRYKWIRLSKTMFI